MMRDILIRVFVALGGLALVSAGCFYAVLAADLLELLGSILAIVCGLVLMARALDGEVDDG